MNKQLQRWIDRPGWQICLYLWGGLGLISMMIYGGILRPEWQLQQRATDKIVEHQQQIEHQQSALAQLPSLPHLQQQIATLSATERSWQPSNPMAHWVGLWITPYGGRVVDWQRQTELEVEAAAGPVKYQQWHATLRVNFDGLLHLLNQLSAITSPVQIQLIGIMRDHSALIVKLNLKEYLAGEMRE